MSTMSPPRKEHQLLSKGADKPHHLVRTSSLEKIRRFNTFIFSQHYFIIPALLAWLKTSQSMLQAAAESTKMLGRSLLVYNLLHIDCRDMFKSRRFLQFTTYFVGVVLTTELGLCIYLLAETHHIPYGLVFLLVCWCYINVLNYKLIFLLFDAEKLKRIVKQKKRG